MLEIDEQATAFIERCLDRFEMPSWADQPPASTQLSDVERSDGAEVTGNTIS